MIRLLLLIVAVCVLGCAADKPAPVANRPQTEHEKTMAELQEKIETTKFVFRKVNEEIRAKDAERAQQLKDQVAAEKEHARRIMSPEAFARAEAEIETGRPHPILGPSPLYRANPVHYQRYRQPHNHFRPMFR